MPLLIELLRGLRKKEKVRKCNNARFDPKCLIKKPYTAEDFFLAKFFNGNLGIYI